MMTRKPLFVFCLVCAGIVGADSSGSSLSPDINGDGIVDISDLKIIASHWLEVDCASVQWCQGADLNQDGRVDLLDFSLLARMWLLVSEPNVPGDMVFITGGDFVMGDRLDEGASDEFPVHPVTLSSYYLSRHVVTHGQYAVFLNMAISAGSIYVDEGFVYGTDNDVVYCATAQSLDRSHIVFSDNTFSLRNKTDGRSMIDDPMVDVTWYGAAAYCNWRSEQEGKQPCYDPVTWECDFNATGYRLPTEAQWEYAARGGLSDSRFPWGDTITHSMANYLSWDGLPYDLSDTRSYHPEWSVGGIPYTSPVGSFAANDYGLYDMAGNVRQWCHDRFGGYSDEPQTDPTGPAAGSQRVVRGGGWNDNADRNRTARRHQTAPDTLLSRIGFRLSLD